MSLVGWWTFQQQVYTGFCNTVQWHDYESNAGTGGLTMVWKFGRVQCSTGSMQILGCKCVDNTENEHIDSEHIDTENGDKEYDYSYNWSDFAWTAVDPVSVQ